MTVISCDLGSPIPWKTASPSTENEMGPNRSPGVWSQRHFRDVTTWQKQHLYTQGPRLHKICWLHMCHKKHLVMNLPTSNDVGNALPYTLLQPACVLFEIKMIDASPSPVLEGLVASHLDSTRFKDSKQFMISGSKAASSRTLPSKNKTYPIILPLPCWRPPSQHIAHIVHVHCEDTTPPVTNKKQRQTTANTQT